MGGARSIICGSETGGIPVWQLELAVRPRRGQAERTRFFYFGPPDTRAVRKSLPDFEACAVCSPVHSADGALSVQLLRWRPTTGHWPSPGEDVGGWSLRATSRHAGPRRSALRPGTASTSQPRGNPHSSTVVHADDDPLLDPRTEPAPIRAMFVHAEWTRRGLGTAILQHAETAAKAEGFSTRSLLATLPGFPLYLRHGFRELDRRDGDV